VHGERRHHPRDTEMGGLETRRLLLSLVLVAIEQLGEAGCDELVLRLLGKL